MTRKLVGMIALILAICCFAVQGFAGTVTLRDTGQTLNYSSPSGVPYENDGYYEAGVSSPSPRFVDNGNGTITDNLTGLMWIKAPVKCFGDMAWTATEAAVNQFNNGSYKNPQAGFTTCTNTTGYSNWSLANINEMLSLVNAQPPNADGTTTTPHRKWLTDTGLFDFTNNAGSGAGPFWSKTTSKFTPGASWGMNVDGWTSVVDQLQGRRFLMVVRVANTTAPARVWQTGQGTDGLPGTTPTTNRGVSWPLPRFTDNLDGTLTDTMTGLIWLRNSQCTDGLAQPSVWSAAVDNVNDNLAHGRCGLLDGSKAGDWRIPNLEEMRSLIDYNYNPIPSGHIALPASTTGLPEEFRVAAAACYWTSTVDLTFYDPTNTISTKDTSEAAWVVCFGSGSGSPGEIKNSKPTFNTTSVPYYVTALANNGTNIYPGSSTNHVLAVRGPKPIAAEASATETTAAVGEAATLDGSLSQDIYGETLTYKWTLSSKPAGSALDTSSISGNNGTDPDGASFVPDAVGNYTFSLSVAARGTSTLTDSVTITASYRPVAAAALANPSQATVIEGETVLINGSGTDADPGDTLTYSWSVNFPGTLTSTDTQNTTFSADCGGTFTVSLVVSDGIFESVADTVSIEVIGDACVSLDVDGDADADANDGVMILRRLLGLPTVTTDIVLPTGVGGSGTNGARTNAEIVALINGYGVGYDVDGDADADANDGVMILRRLLGLPTVTTDIVLPTGVGGSGTNGARTNAEIVSLIDSLKP